MNQRVNWNNTQNPINMTIDKVLYEIRRADAGESLLFDSCTMADIMEDADEIMVFDALVTPYAKLQRKMEVLKAVMERGSDTIKPLAVQISEPFKQGGVAQVAVVFELSDGQTVSIFFHNPDVDPKKITATDELISWKWLLNKKDITIVVAPEKGQDLNVKIVAERIIKLAAKNSPAFARANVKRSENMAAIQAIKDEIPVLEKELADAQHELEVLKVDAESKPVNVKTIDFLLELGWKYNGDNTELRYKNDDNLFIVANYLVLEAKAYINRWNTGDTGGYVGLESIDQGDKTNEQFANEINDTASKLTQSNNPVADHEAFKQATLQSLIDDFGWENKSISGRPLFWVSKTIGGGFTGGVMNPTGNRNLSAKIEGTDMIATHGDNVVARSWFDVSKTPKENAGELDMVVNSIDPRFVKPVVTPEPDVIKPEVATTEATDLEYNPDWGNPLVYIQAEYRYLESGWSNAGSSFEFSAPEPPKPFENMSSYIANLASISGLSSLGTVSYRKEEYNHRGASKKGVKHIGEVYIKGANDGAVMITLTVNNRPVGGVVTTTYGGETTSNLKAFLESVYQGALTAKFDKPLPDSMEIIERISGHAKDEANTPDLLPEATTTSPVKYSVKATFAEPGGNPTFGDKQTCYVEWKHEGKSVYGAFVAATDYDKKEFGLGVFRSGKGEFQQESIAKIDPKGMKLYFVNNGPYVEEGIVTWDTPVKLTRLIIFNKPLFEKAYIPLTESELEAIKYVSIDDKAENHGIDVRLALSKMGWSGFDAGDPMTINNFRATATHLYDGFNVEQLDNESGTWGYVGIVVNNLDKTADQIANEIVDLTTAKPVEEVVAANPNQAHIDAIQKVVDGQHDDMDLSELLDMIDAAATALIDAGLGDENDDLIGKAAEHWAMLDEKLNG